MAEEPKSMTTAPGGLGTKRYLYFAFLAGGALAAYVVGKLLGYAWGFFAEPRDFTVLSISAVVGFGGAIVAYRNPTVNQLANEVISELSKVTWPTRKELTAATIVVVVVSTIAAAILGTYDAFWSWLTDLIYLS